MQDINDFRTIGVFDTKDIKGLLPLSNFEYDKCKVYFVAPTLQQCEVYSTETKTLKIYRRKMLGDLNFTVWIEVKDWYELL